MKSDYQCFEGIHRGSREVIIERLKFYLPYVVPLKEVYEKPKALDLGCGRGEWLQLMHEYGIDAYGVDIDEGILAQVPTNVAVVKRDLLEYLKAQKDASFVCVSCFHVVERIDIILVPELIVEAKRVLVPGGMLIIETPNSENLSVGTDTFYIDPNHWKPVSKIFLFRHCEQVKFRNIKLVGVNNVVADDAEPSMSKIVYGVSPDYAIIAQTDAPYEVLKKNHDILKREVGTNLEKVVSEFDSTLNHKISQHTAHIDFLREKTIENRERLIQFEDSITRSLAQSSNHLDSSLDAVVHNISKNVSSKVEKEVATLRASIHTLQQQLKGIENQEKRELYDKLDSLEIKISKLSVSIRKKEECIEWLDNEWHDALRKRDHYYLAVQDLERKLAGQHYTQEQLHQSAREIQKHLDAVYQSWSWRLSLPLRLPGKLWRSFRNALRWLLVKGIGHALNNRLITLAFLKILGPFPEFRARLNRLYLVGIRNSHSNRDENAGLPPETNEDLAHFYSLLTKGMSKK